MTSDLPDLDAIKARSETTRRMNRFRSVESDAEVMALVAEVRHLRAANKRMTDNPCGLQVRPVMSLP